MSVISPQASDNAAADPLSRLGGVPLWRIRRNPPPGEATAEDVLRIHAAEKRLFELVDGVLVEKTVELVESFIASQIGHLLRTFIVPRRLGLVANADGMYQIEPQFVRIPDVSFVSLARLRSAGAPLPPSPSLVPNLAVEVLSKRNTKPEIEVIIAEYFEAGVELVWLVDLRSRTIEVVEKDVARKTLNVGDTLTAEPVLPGFSCHVADFFVDLDLLPANEEQEEEP